MIEEFEMTWLSLVENYVFAAVSQGCAQIAIFRAHFACGPTALRVLKVAQLQLENVVVVWEALGKLGYHCSLSWG